MAYRIADYMTPRNVATTAYRATPAVQQQEPSRSILDRLFGVINNNSLVEGLYNITDDDPSTTFLQGVGKGVAYMNPFRDDVSERRMFSDVLGNVGWQPESLPGRVARGVVGLAGDIALDPLTYTGGVFSAGNKIVKGTGVTREAVEQAGRVANASVVAQNGIEQANRVGKVLDNLNDARSGVTANKVLRMAELNTDDALKVIKDRIAITGEKLTEEEIFAQAMQLKESFDSKVLGLVQKSGDGISIGFRNVPFTGRIKLGDKKLSEFQKTIVSSQALRQLGDNTIAPYYNSLAQKIKVSNIGKAFSPHHAEAVVAQTDKLSAAALHYTDMLVNGKEMFGKRVEGVLEGVRVVDNTIAGMSEADQAQFILAYETGLLADAFSVKGFRNSLQERMSRLTDNKVTKDQFKNMLRNYDDLEKEVAEFVTKMNPDKKVRFEADIMKLTGKAFSEMDVAERIKATSLFAKTRSPFGITQANGGMKDVIRFMQTYDLNEGFYSDIPFETVQKIKSFKKSNIDMVTEQGANKMFMSLDANTRDAIVRAYTNQNQYAFVKGISDKLASGGLDNAAIFNSLSDSEKRLVQYADNLQQYRTRGVDAMVNSINLRALNANLYDLTEKKTFSEQLSRTINRMEPVVDGSFGTIKEALGLAPSTDMNQFKRLLDWVETNATPASKTESLFNLLSTKFDEMAQQEVRVGKLSEDQARIMKDRYIAHLLTPEGKKLLEAHDLSNSHNWFDPVFGQLKDFHKSRTMKTIDATNEIFGTKVLEDNLSDIFFARAMASNRLVYGADVSKYVEKYFGKTMDVFNGVDNSIVVPQQELRKLSNAIRNSKNMQKKGLSNLFETIGIDEQFATGQIPFVKLTPEQAELYNRVANAAEMYAGHKRLEPMVMDNALLDKITHLSSVQNAALQSDMLNLFDKYQVLWKLSNTLVNPGFHGQNALSNAFMGFLDVGADAIDPAKIKRAYHILATNDPKATMNLGGKRYTYRDLRTMAKEYDVVGGFFNKDLDEGIAATRKAGDLGRFGVPGKYDPTNMIEFTPYVVGNKVGSTIEETQRMVIWLSHIDQGMDAANAARKVNEWLFDYGALTEFEKKVMKRVIPFYTYMSKNVPKQLEIFQELDYMYRNLNYSLEEIERMSGNYIPDEERNEWRQDYTQLPFADRYGININMPYQQLGRITPNRLLGQASPFIKAPVELAMGQYAYTGIPIQSASDYAVNTLPTLSAIQEIAANKPLGEKLAGALGETIGLPIKRIKRGR